MKSSVHVNLSCLHLSLWRKTCFVENPVTMDAMTVRRCHHNGSKTGHRLVNYAVLWGSGRGRGWGSWGKEISGRGTSATQWCRGVIGDKNHIQVLKSKSWNLKWAAIPHPQKYTCIHLLRGLVLFPKSWNREFQIKPIPLRSSLHLDILSNPGVQSPPLIRKILSTPDRSSPLIGYLKYPWGSIISSLGNLDYPWV